MDCVCQKLAGGRPLDPACLGSIWLFADLGEADRRALLARAVRRRYDQGATIFRQGAPADRMFLIKAGRVKLSKVSEEGRELTLDLRKGGDFLGEGMLTREGGEFPLSAVCLEETFTCGFDRPSFEALVLERPGLGLQVIRNLSRRIEWLTARMGDLACSHLEERLYRVLLRMAREHGSSGGQELILPLPFTHEELSFLLGAHRVSVTRALKELRETGRVRQEGGAFIIRAA